MFRVVDLAAKERDARAVFLGIVDKFEGVVGGAGAAAEDTDDEVGIVLSEFLHRARAVIDDFQKKRAAGFRDAGEAAEDVVVDEFAKLFRRDTAADVRIEDFEEVAEILPLRFFAEFFEGEEGFAVLLEIVDERDGVEAEVCAGEIGGGAVALDFAALDLVNRGGAEGLGGFAGVTAVADGPDIGGVVGAGGGGDAGVAEQSFLDRELFVDVSGHEHDVHEALVNDFADDVEKLGKVAVAEFGARPQFGRKPHRPLAAPREIRARAGSAHPKGHVRVLGVRDDERAGGRIGLDLGEFGVERLHYLAAKEHKDREERLANLPWFFAFCAFFRGHYFTLSLSRAFP